MVWIIRKGRVIHMLKLDKHPYFKEYIDPESDVKSYFLTKKVAQLQQNFYFTDSSLTTDGKYLWIRCLNPPAQCQNLAVISMDEANPFIRNFPGAGCNRGLPSIIPGTHDVLFGEDLSIYRVNVEGDIQKVITLDKDFLNFRNPQKIMTHASLSCDGKYIILDIEMADKTYIATGNLQTGEFKVIHKFGRCYDHAMFSPNDPNLIMLDQDWWRDWHTGEYFGIDNRIWLMDIRGPRFESLLPNRWYGHDDSEIAHDFWSKDGKICWVDYAHGAFECDIDTREVTHVWKRPLCHCHTTADRQYWCGDETPYAWKERPCKVLFYDRESQKEIDIFSALPCPKVERNDNYHLDPHPSFTDDGEYIISTVTLLDGNADVAITPVRELIKKCRENGIRV